MNGMTSDRAARLVAAFDASGVHRASTPGDAASGAWLVEEAEHVGASVTRMAVALDRTVITAAHLECGGQRIDGLPMFDAPPAREVRGRLVPCGESGEIGYLEMAPNAASIKGQPMEAIRRETRHAALVVATRVTGESLAPINAQFFPGTIGPPTLLVAGMQHAFLAEQAKAGAQATFVADYSREPAHSFNVIAEVEGSELPPIAVVTPRTGWWESTAERAGGLVAWLAAVESAASAKRALHGYATCGHELGHVGLDALIARDETLARAPRCWLHLGANLGCASNLTLFVRATDPAEGEAMSDLLAAEGYPREHIRVEPAAKLSGEGWDLARHGARVLSLAGANAHFHAASDRWPANVNAAGIAAISRAVARWAAGIR
jgi:hypothetical protein